jgi:hypothetical protein
MIAKRLALAVILCLPLAIQAQQPPQKAPQLPRTFTGIFEWRGTNPMRERVTLTIDSVEEKDGVITFTGTQTYQGAMLTEKATGRIDRKTGKISLRVSDPSGPAITEGSFEGTISANLDAITTVWIGQNGGMDGDLKLTGRAP